MNVMKNFKREKMPRTFLFVCALARDYEDGCLVIGELQEGEIFKGDDCFHYGEETNTVHVEMVINQEDEEILSAKKGEDISLFLTKIDAMQIREGDLITNMDRNAVKETQTLHNKRVSELLNEIKTQASDDLYEELFSEIAERAGFLSLVHFSKQPVAQKDGSYLLQDDTNIQFPVLVSPEKRTYYPAFTDMMEMQKWEDQDLKASSILTLHVDDYVEMLKRDKGNHGIVINPFNQSFIIEKEMLDHLIEVRDKEQPVKRRTIFDNM